MNDVLLMAANTHPLRSFAWNQRPSPLLSNPTLTSPTPLAHTTLQWRHQQFRSSRSRTIPFLTITILQPTYVYVWVSGGGDSFTLTYPKKLHTHTHTNYSPLIKKPVYIPLTPVIIGFNVVGELTILHVLKNILPYSGEKFLNFSFKGQSHQIWISF